jgi:hypothetical protein
MGGPIKRDKVWFFSSFRSGDNQQTQQGNYFNAKQGTLFYQADTSRPANTDQWSKDYTGRVTWQVTQKNKIVVAASSQPNCNCFFNLLNPTGGIPWAPEVSAQHRYNPQVDTNVSWKVPITERLLLDTDFAYLYVDQRTVRQPSTGLDVQVTDTGLNYRYGSRALNLGTTGSYIFVPRTQTQPQFTLSYVTGEHVFKTGVMLRWFHTGDASRNTDPNQINQGRDYTFRNGSPTNVRIWAVPYAWEENGRDHSVFAQDQWTLRRRLTLNLGVRYNDTLTSLPEVHLAPGPFVGERVLPAVKNHPHWQNLNPRVGAAFDLRGDGKTAVKVSLGRYNPPLRSTTTNPPAAGITPSTNRTWNDGNTNFIPDCDLLNPNTNGECGPWSDRTFGQNIIPTREAPDAISGFNAQGAFNGGTNWQFSSSMQRELRPGMGVNLGYFRTWYSGFLATDNQAVTPGDYDRYCFTAPTDSRLAMSGKEICGYDIKPAKFGLNDSVITQASNFGPRTQIYNGLDFTMNARLKEGAQISGGLSTGRTVEDSCATVDYPQDAKTGVGANIIRANTDPIVPGYCRSSPPWLAGTQLKFMLIYPLPFSVQTSVIYQNIAGIENSATYTATNAQIAPSLGRNLAQCSTAAVCTATVTMALDPPGASYEPRLQQVDVRFSRSVRMNKYRLRGSVDIANLFNANSVLNVQRQYGPTYLNVLQIMGGRLVKLGFQVDF